MALCNVCAVETRRTLYAGLGGEALSESWPKPSCVDSHALFMDTMSAHRISRPFATNTSVPRRAIVLLGPGMYCCFRGLAFAVAPRDAPLVLEEDAENRPRPSGESVDSHDGVNARIFGIAAAGADRHGRSWWPELVAGITRNTDNHDGGRQVPFCDG